MVKYSRKVKQVLLDCVDMLEMRKLRGINLGTFFLALAKVDKKFLKDLKSTNKFQDDEIFDRLESCMMTLNERNSLDFFGIREILENNKVIGCNKEIYATETVESILVEAEILTDTDPKSLNIVSIDALAIAAVTCEDSEELRSILKILGTENTRFKKTGGSVQKSTSTSIVIPELLSTCITNLNEKMAKKDLCGILGRDAECEEIWRIMLKESKRNVILVGDAGVGKSSIVYKLAFDIAKGKAPKYFKGFTILSLDTNSMIAGTKYRGEAESKYQEIISLMESNDKIILFIDEIHTIIGAGSTSVEDNNDFSNALKPILAGDTARVIGATTTEEYERFFSEQSAVKRRFHTIEVKEPKTEELYPMLRETITILEKFHGVKLSKEMFDYIVLNASCFDYETKNPDRTKDLIDLAMATAKKDGKTKVDKASVMANFKHNLKAFEKMPEEKKKRTAYHELGHYIMWYFTPNKDKTVQAVSIIPADDYLGVNVFEMNEEALTEEQDIDYFINYMAEQLAGRVAECIFGIKINSGASSDLRKATKAAYNAVVKYGLTSVISKNRVYLDESGYSMTTEKSIETVNKEIDRLIDAAYTRAEKIITKNT